MHKALLLFLMNLASRAIALAAGLALPGMAMAQINLVPNGSFEDTVNCHVQGLYSLLTAAHWSSPNMATPDVYDCDLVRSCGEPMDPEDIQGVVSQGYQAAHDGSRFAAGFQWYGPGVPAKQDTREYLMVRLTEAMEMDRPYEVSLFYSRAEGFRYAISHLGVYFGNDSVSVAHPVVLALEEQVALRDALNPYLLDGDSWTQLTDTFVAAGGEEWMIIGTFNGSDEVDGIAAFPLSNFSYAYYYMDEVSVRPLEWPNALPELSVSYAGSGSIGFDWRGSGSMDRLRLFDASGRLFMDSSTGWLAGDHELVLPAVLGPGVYLVEGWSNGGRWVARFVKEDGVF